MTTPRDELGEALKDSFNIAKISSYFEDKLVKAALEVRTPRTPRGDLEERLKDDEFALLFAEADRKADNQINRARWRCWLKRLILKLREALR